MKTQKSTKSKAPWTVRECLDACILAARDAGYDGDADDYTLTDGDLDWVAEKLGRAPSVEEWVEARREARLDAQLDAALRGVPGAR